MIRIRRRVLDRASLKDPRGFSWDLYSVGACK